MANPAGAIAPDQPLAGRRIVVTRARQQAGRLTQRIAALGGEVIEFPTIEIEPPTSFIALDAAIGRLDSYDWVFFTSANGVKFFLARLQFAGKAAVDLAGAKVVAVGSETAKRLAEAGVAVAVIPSSYRAEGILASLEPEEFAGRRVLLPRAAQARDLLPDTLRQWGAVVEVVEAYRTVAPAFDAASILRRFRGGEVDMVIFTSSSTVTNFVQLCGGGLLAAITGSARIASIGPITAQTIVELGGQVTVLARQSTIDGLINALVEYFAGEKN
jgi:uroporphyrinogen III methyltransferase/synthase